MDGAIPRPQLVWPKKLSEVPREVFHREDIFQQELARIFYGPEWHPVAHAAELPKVGDFKTARVGQAEVLVYRVADSSIRVFENVCPHRGTQLKTCARGSGTKIECPYHRWQFTIEGDLIGAPHMQDFPSTFRRENYGLRRVQSEVRHGIVFVTFGDEAPPIDEYLLTVAHFIGMAIPEGEALRFLGYQKVLFDTNWKEYSDQEGYHAPLLHKAFQILKWRGGAGERWVTKYGHGAVHAQLREPPKTTILKDDSLIRVRDPSVATRSVVIALFPLGAILRHIDVITLRYAIPLSPHQTEVHYAYFARQDDDAAMARHRVRQASNLLGPSGFISLEDGAVFNRLHRGSSTPGVVEFQKGVGRNLNPPCEISTNDECGNLVKWERYRQIMGFERDQ
jgi:anthranilate 1,2-dioxygenase large subunit